MPSVHFYGSALAVAVGLSMAGSAATSTPAAPLKQQAAASTGCTGTAHVYGVRRDGTLTYAPINAATNTKGRGLVGAKLPWPVRSLAALSHDTLLVTTTGGALYRVDITSKTKTLKFATPVPMAYTGWTYDKLATDGAGHLFATLGTNGQLFRWDLLAKKPTGGQIANKVRMGSGVLVSTLTGVAGSRLMGTTTSGKLIGINTPGAGRITQSTLASTGYDGVGGLASAGGGLFFSRTAATEALTTRKDANIADGVGTDISLIGSVDTSGWTQKLISAAPRNVVCPSGGITYDNLVTMFGQSWVGERSTVEAGLPSLQAEMVKGQVNNPARKAAFLATLVSESAMRYNADQGGSFTYRGRGYIQLTNDFNYKDAGSYFGINLLSSPDLAKSLQYSAPIARWYWTVARTTTNTYADNHDMNGVNRNIGFAWNYEEATKRCERFKSAYKFFTGSYPSNTICYPARLPAPGDREWYAHPERSAS
ncbi:glycoside hydrolase family 19 protein [Nostocoides veronense]|uniref:Glycoside hydrolase family 19 catalytic domain-containing protein n=1 Tax=Nostocoides veronense TaxID=330836 RepID=A0ABP4Y4U4_9MICO